MVPVKGFDGHIRLVRLAPTALPGAKNDIVVPVTSAFGRLDLCSHKQKTTQEPRKTLFMIHLLRVLILLPMVPLKPIKDKVSKCHWVLRGS